MAKGVLAIEIPNPLIYESLEELIEGIINFLLVIAIAITPIMVVAGAFYILMSADDPKKRQTGQQIILYTVIGLGIMLLSKAIISAIRYLLKPFGG